MNNQSEYIITRIPWGKNDSIDFVPPAGWNFLGSMVPAKQAPLADVEKELDKILTNPIGAPPLRELAKGKQKITIVVDDISRPTPAYLLMGKILEHLATAGADLGAITIVPGLGLHREMSQQDMEHKVGKENLAKVRWENPGIRDRSKLAYLGKTVKNTRAFIHKTVANADLRVLVGTIEPHPHAGFGGGFKNILPGVAGVETISHNHAICATPKLFSLIGTDPDTNPMRRDIEDVGRMLRGDTFIVNTVLNSDIKIVRIVAGDPIAAHREGVKTARKIFGAKMQSQADVLITNSYPLDIDLRQAVKGVANTLFAAKPGGIILAMMHCEEGMGNMRFPDFKMPNLPPQVTKFILKLLAEVISHVSPPGISPEERFSIYFFLKALMRNRIYIYAPNLADDIDGVFPAIRVFRDFDAAIKAIQREMPRADVAVFPMGGITYPVL